MTTFISRLLWALTALGAGVAVQSTSIALDATQRAGTVTTVIKPEQPRDLPALLKRVEELERRVEKLEKDDIKEFKGPEEAANAKKLEARLAALEKAQQADGTPAAGPAAPRPGAQSSSTVRAPFVVQDASGKVLLSVGIAAENGEAELVLGNREGARAALRVTRRGGASLGMYDASNTARVALVGNPDDSLFRIGGKGAAVNMATTEGVSRVDLTNAAGHAGVSLEIRADHGRLALGDAAGETTVEAGTVRGTGVGVVRAGPDLGGAVGAMSGGLVIPRAIMGKKK